jgi:WD40 repeat protein
MTSRPRASQEEEAGGQQQQQRKSKRRRSSGSQSGKKLQEDQTMALEASNGADANGSVASYTGPQGLINKSEYLRLMQQSLAQLGFNDVAELLEKQSGVPRQSSTTSNLTECVLSGDWNGALEAVRGLDLVPKIAAQVPFLILENKFLEILESGDELAAIKCLRNDLAPLSVNTERLHGLSRKLLAAKDKQTSSASPSTSAGAAAAASTIAKTSAGRRKLLVALQNIVPAGTLLPENRLEELVEQALAAQIEKCRFHNTLHPRISLLRDYTCGLEQLPLNCCQILDAHTSEVWHLQFSHNGKMLASCGRDNTVILWDVLGGAGGCETHNEQEGGKSTITQSPRLCVRRILKGHTSPVLFVAWSLDDSRLASCGQDSLVFLWNTDAPTSATESTESCLKILKHHTEPVLSVSWLPDNKTLVTAGQDRMVAVVSIHGEVFQNWRAHRMQDVCVTAGGRYILASTHDRRINIYEALIRPKEIIEKEKLEMADDGEDDDGVGVEEMAVDPEEQQERDEVIKAIEAAGESNLDEKWLFAARFDPKKQRDSMLLDGEDLMAFSSSPCGRYILANLRDGTLSLWDIGSRLHHRNHTFKVPARLISRFSPPGNVEGTLGRFVVRSCIGGVGAKFITTGTESGKVPIWQRDTGELLAVLEGHRGVVNAVAWNHKMPEMLATASDDGTVRIWMSDESSGGGGKGGGDVE